MQSVIGNGVGANDVAPIVPVGTVSLWSGAAGSKQDFYYVMVLLFLELPMLDYLPLLVLLMVKVMVQRHLA